MTTPYLGQVAAFAFGFAPRGWALCNGQTMPINQNQALFALLGTQFGGDGISNFKLPNLQGSFAVAQGPANVLGQTGGEVNHTLTSNELAAHNHPMFGSSANGSSTSPVGNFPGVNIGPNGPIYGGSPNTTLGTGSSPFGSGLPHPNMPPFLVINFCIALTGVFPPRN